ncbi:glycosyltransferase family 4 protein [Magnetofaba australis]|nr:glycosyltransferase family 4 protein [Magnetofaba australis]
MARIVMLTPWFPETPDAQQGKFILDSAQALAQRGHSVLAIVAEPYRLGGARRKPDWLPAGVCWRALRYPSAPRYVARGLTQWFCERLLAPQVAHMAQTFGADLLHGHNERLAAVAIRAGRAAQAPVVATWHGVETHPRMQRSKAQAFVGRVQHGVDRAVVVGDALRRHYPALAQRPDGAHTVHNGFRPVDAAAVSRAPWSDPWRVVSVSNLQPGKGIDVTLRALAQLRNLPDWQGDWRYDVIGDGPQRRSLEALSHSLGLAQRVRFHGRLKHDQLAVWLGQAHLFCLPSQPEAFGIAYLEAMSAGCLALGVAGEGPSAFIVHGQSGVLAQEPSPDLVAAHLQELRAHPSTAQQIALAGQERVLSEFTWARHAERLESLYAQLLRACDPQSASLAGKSL